MGAATSVAEQPLIDGLLWSSRAQQLIDTGTRQLLSFPEPSGV